MTTVYEYRVALPQSNVPPGMRIFPSSLSYRILSWNEILFFQQLKHPSADSSTPRRKSRSMVIVVVLILS